MHNMEKFNENTDLDIGELDPSTGERIFINRSDLKIKADEKIKPKTNFTNFNIDKDLKNEILKSPRSSTFIGDEFTIKEYRNKTEEEKEREKRFREEENKKEEELKNKIYEALRKKRRKEGKCEHCGGDPCLVSCLHR